jgi:hypothetical protein
LVPFLKLFCFSFLSLLPYSLFLSHLSSSFAHIQCFNITLPSQNSPAWMSDMTAWSLWRTQFLRISQSLMRTVRNESR